MDDYYLNVIVLFFKVPTEFLIEIVPPHEHSSYRTRHVLNIEKTVFSTDNVTKVSLVIPVLYQLSCLICPSRFLINCKCSIHLVHLQCQTAIQCQYNVRLQRQTFVIE